MFDFVTRWTAVMVRSDDDKWRLRAIHFGTNHLDNPVLTKVRQRQRAKEQTVFLIRGGPGTGKSVVAVNPRKLFCLATTAFLYARISLTAAQPPLPEWIWHDHQVGETAPLSLSAPVE